MMDELIGKTLGPYQILERIGRGGMATVYKAYQPALDRIVAVKVLPAHLAEAPGFGQRFQREARAVARLEHPNILAVHDFGQQDDLSYLVMRYVEGGTLKDLLGKPLPLERVPELISQIADALDHAHERGVIHRDVKPGNVLLDPQGRVLLTDFGLARIVQETQQITGTGVGVGTPAYMSPEQGQGRTVDRRSDVYSLGVVLYEMLTGKVPYEGETPLAVVWKHVHEPLPLPRRVQPSIPEAVERVLLKALAKAPQDRFQTTADLSYALKDAAREMERPSARKEPSPTRVGVGAAERPVAPSGLRRLWWIVPLLLVVVVGGGLLLPMPAILPGGGPESARTKGIPTSTRRVAAQTPTELVELLVPTMTSPPAPTPLSLPATPFICDDPLGCVVVLPNEPIRLGYLLAVSGADATLGLDSKYGAEIAIDDKGGKLLGHEIALEGEDDGCNPDLAKAGALKLLEDTSIVAIIGTSCSSGARVAAPILSEAGFTMISPSNTSPDLTDPEKHVEGYFRTAHNDNMMGTGAARFAFEELGFRRVAAIHDGGPHAEALANVFARNFKGLGGTVTGVEAVGPDDTDMKPALTRIAASKPQLIYFPVWVKAGGFICAQMRNVPGLEETVMMGADGIFTPDFVKACGENVVGMYWSSPEFSGFSAGYAELVEKYKAKYNVRGTPAPFHAHAYDAANIIFSAIEKVAKVSSDGTVVMGRRALRDAIAATKDFKGLTGNLTCNENGDCADPLIAVYELKDKAEYDAAVGGTMPKTPIWKMGK